MAESVLRVRPLWAALNWFPGQGSFGPVIREVNFPLETDFCGVRVSNPVGIAAGFDKNCRMLGSLLTLGFGFVVGGTVTLGPRPGNPRPRLVRDRGSRALVNSLGFPGQGLEAAERRLRRLSLEDRARTFVSVAGTEDHEVIECHSRLESHVSGLEINISSPNTAGLRVYQEPERLRALVARLAATKKRPLLIKLPRYGEPEGEGRIVALARSAAEAGADGVVVANTLPVKDRRLAVGQGGLSGAPLLDSTVRLVEAVRHAVPGHVAIVGCGGVFTGQEARRVLSAGAAAIQIYTAFIYEGPGLPGRLARELARQQ